MFKLLRYALATFSIAARVDCLALWWRADARRAYMPASVTCFQVSGFYFEAWAGAGVISLDRESLFSSVSDRKALSNEDRRAAIIEDKIRRSRLGSFGKFRRSIYFPLWYPALIFAFAGVAALSFRRQFSIRSTLVATTIVAALIGMAVIL